jgi:hypothetical protein
MAKNFGERKCRRIKPLLHIHFINGDDDDDDDSNNNNNNNNTHFKILSKN